MCGIFGIVHDRKYQLSNSQFKSINNENYNRGPDNQGHIELDIINKKVKLGHSRLSILDLSNEANQPMESFNQRFIISFNGEIYNHLELRKELNQIKKIKWKTTSDTETLLNLFETFSFLDVLKKIEGMFALILIDQKNKKLFVARDLAGEKPLYFCFNKFFMSFASDLKTLIKLPNLSKNIDQVSVQNFLEFNYIPSPRTIYKNIYKLPPASYITIDLDKFIFDDLNYYNDLNSFKGIDNGKWWNLDYNKTNNQNLNSKNYQEKLNFHLKESVKKQLISDVPLGAFLSGGIDSSLIVSLMQQSNNNTKTFTIGFNDKNYDESFFANQIANYLSTDHTSYIFSESDINNTIQNSSMAYSEPFSDSSQLPTLLVSKIAKENVKVVLTGDGGDELFGGYNRYIYANKFWKFLKILNPNVRNTFLITLLKFTPNKLIQYLGKYFNLHLNPYSIDKIILKLKKIKNEQTYYQTLTHEWTPDSKIFNFNNLNNQIPEVEKIFSKKELLFEEKMMMSDFMTYLPDDILCKVDRATMNYSLESRAPFLDKNIIELAFKIPLKYKIHGGYSKIILKKILKKYLPDNLINKSKKGFGIPIGELMRGTLKTWTNDVLSKDRCAKHGFFNYDIIEQEKNNHFKNLSNNQYKLWSLIQFNEWYFNIHMNNE